MGADESSKYFVDRAAIGRRLAEILTFTGLSQSGLARELGISQTFISAVVLGKSAPSVALMSGLLLRFNVDVGWLLTGNGRMQLSVASAEAPPAEVATGETARPRRLDAPGLRDPPEYQELDAELVKRLRTLSRLAREVQEGVADTERMVTQNRRPRPTRRNG